MSLSMDEKLIQMENELRNSRKEIIKRKMQLLKDFRVYALKKIKQSGRPFEVDYSSFNGSETLLYHNLNIGDDINLVIIFLKFNPQTQIISDYSKKVFKGKKQKEDFRENMSMPGNSYDGETREPYHLNCADDIEKALIFKELRKQADELLMRIFKGRLTYDDDEYKRLVATNIALEEELQRLETRINALSLINSSNELEESETKQHV